MDKNTQPEKTIKEKKDDKLKLIGPKHAILYWVMAIVSVVILILLLNYNKNNKEERKDNSSATASIIVESLDYI